MIKHIVSGTLMSLLVAGTLVSVNAAPASASELPLLHADIDAWQVTLQDGRLSTDSDQIGTVELLKDSVSADASDAFTLGGSYADHWRYRRGKVEYRIVMLDQPTNYWVKLTLEDHVGVQSRCDVYSGEPNAGGVIDDEGPFTCSGGTPKIWEDHTRLAFHVGLNRDAEASGSIVSTGDVSLHKGVYETFGLPYHKGGLESVTPHFGTVFDAVLRKGDKTPFDEQARTEFAYQIYDKGTPTTFWVAGLSTNWRGPSFNGDGRCAIYNENPLAGGKHLDDSKPTNDPTPFTCEADGSYVSGPHETGHGHFDSHFVVSQK